MKTKSTRKYLSIFLAILMILSALPMTMSYAAGNIVAQGQGFKFYDDGQLSITAWVASSEYYNFLNTYRQQITLGVVEEGVTQVARGTFNNLPALKEVRLADSVTSLDYYSFANSTALETIDLKNVRTIYDHAFAGCTSLKNIDLSKVNYIKYNAFSGCTSLEEVNLGSIYEIGNEAFEDCTGIKSISIAMIPKEGASLGKYVFENCTGLKSVHLAKGVKKYGIGWFRGCTGLEEVFIPEGMNSIPDYTFSECGFVDLVIPEGIQFIGDYAFSNCPYLKSVTFEDDATFIGDHAFDGCLSLEEINFKSNSLVLVEEGAFKYCVSLEEVVFPDDSIYMIGEGAFSDCYGLSKIYLGKNALMELDESAAETELVAAYAFANCIDLEEIYVDDCYKAVNINPAALVTSIADEDKEAIKEYFELYKELWTLDSQGLLDEELYAEELERFEALDERFWEIVDSEEDYQIMSDVAIIAGADSGIKEYIEDTGLVFKCIAHPEDAIIVAEEATPATCTATGLTEKRICSYCGEVVADHEVTPKLSHKAGEAVIEKGVAPTCTAKGTDYQVVKCKDCGEELSRTPVEVKATGHSYVEKETVAPTCTAKGYTVYECEGCGTRYSDNFVDATGHDLEEIDFVAPTCQTEGKIVYGCACGYTEEVAIEKAPHTFDSDIATIGLDDEYAIVTPATCQHEGYTTYICATCGATKVGAYTPKTAHTYSASPVAKTCTTKGYTVYTCECGECYKGDYVAANGHTDSNGDYVCDDCGVELAKPHVARCSWCDKADQNFIFTIIHFFIHAFTAR